MPSSLPSAVPPYSVTRNFSRAVHVVAVTCLAGAVLIVLAFQAFSPGLALWPALPALLPIAVALWLVDRYRDPAFSVLYLLAGAASVYAFTLAIAEVIDPVLLSRAVLLELPKIALIMVGGSGTGAASSLRWCTAGYLAAEAMSAAALLQLGVPWRFDGVTAGAFGVAALLLVMAWLNRRRADRTRPRFTSAARDELVAALRYRIETRAAALLHDTVLSHLAAVAATPSGPLDVRLSGQIARDLEKLTSDAWLESDEPDRVVDGDDGWRRSPVYTAIRDSRTMGLEVGVTGDTAALLRLDAEHATELGFAVKQSLVNVLRHAGTRDAEVAVYGAEDELLVMVVDSGSGFDESANPADRMGVRTAIRGRIEAIGGSTQIWSTLGRGTSVVLRVPVANASRPAVRADRSGSPR